jgi:hypothetical protein
MKPRASSRRLLPLLIALIGVHLVLPAGAALTNAFRFEVADGYIADSDLVGQGPWTGSGSGGNGILSGFFPGEGQQAYVGYSPPTGTDDQLVVWPTNQFNPVAAGLPLVKFTVLMQIADSLNGDYDFFQWRVYNRLGQRLFILDFDNYFTNINYRLDGNSDYTNTGFYFAPDVIYRLSITMNFASNRWSAMLDDTVIVPNLPITTTNAALTFGDVDAAWSVYSTNAPGDNFMIFDNYQVIGESLTNASVPPARLQFLGRTVQGWALLRVWGQDQSRWSLDATTNFVNWMPLRTNRIDGAFDDHVDMTASPFARRFYRSRLVP